MPNFRFCTDIRLSGDGLHIDLTYTDAGVAWTDATMVELNPALRPSIDVNGVPVTATYVSAQVVGSNLVVHALLGSLVYEGDAITNPLANEGWLANATSQETGASAVGITLSGGSFEPPPAERRAGSIGIGDMGIEL